MNSGNTRTAEEGGAHFPWVQFMMIAMRALGWSPETFWRSTPLELQAFSASLNPVSYRFDRAALERLQQAFPDMHSQTETNGPKEIE